MFNILNKAVYFLFIFSGIKKAMVSAMTQALTIPHMGLKDEIDVSELIKIQKQMKVIATERGIKLSYMPLLIKVDIMGKFSLEKYMFISFGMHNTIILQYQAWIDFW